MQYAIIGFGQIGQALAQMFARRGLEVAVASRRGPEALTPAAQAIGSTVVPTTLADAVKADTLFLAVPFRQHPEVAQLASDWTGQTIIDVTNAFGVPVEDLGGLPSSAVVARAFPGAKLVKGFNHLPAGTFAGDPQVGGLRRAVFLASDDADAVAPVAALAEQLGYAPVNLGTLAGGGALVQARDRQWAPLNFQDLFKQG